MSLKHSRLVIIESSDGTEPIKLQWRFSACYYQNTMHVINLVVSGHSVLPTDRQTSLIRDLEIVANVTVASTLNFICIILHYAYVFTKLLSRLVWNMWEHVGQCLAKRAL